MYYLTFFSTPFESVDGQIDAKSLLAGRFTFPANEQRNFSKDFLDLIRSMLTADVTKYILLLFLFVSVCLISRRPSISEILQSGCEMTRWRMTEEVKVALDYIERKEKGERGSTTRSEKAERSERAGERKETSVRVSKTVKSTKTKVRIVL